MVTTHSNKEAKVQRETNEKVELDKYNKFREEVSV